MIQEKTAVQRGLLYLESVFGRPNNKDERDAARALYDRYRTIKRTINRSVTLSTAGASGGGCGSGLFELPTILEHEAMHFTVTAAISTPRDSDSASIGEASTKAAVAGVDSPTETSTFVFSTDTTDTSSSVQENIHTQSLDELWKHQEMVLAEKKQLRRIINEFETVFEERNGRKMLKSDRSLIEETYAQYKQKKAELRLIEALIYKNIANPAK